MDTPETTRGNDPRGQDGIDYDQPADNPLDSEQSLEEIVDELDAETLEQRQHAHSTTNRDKRDRCPKCGSVNLVHKVGRVTPVRKAGEYRCGNCGKHFDEPVTPDADQKVATDGGLDGDCPECGSSAYDRDRGTVQCPDCDFEYECVTDGGVGIERQHIVAPGDGTLTVAINGTEYKYVLEEGDDVVFEWQEESR
jgi:DNA-directed RNA polymerase subunit RPC12/RpoP